MKFDVEDVCALDYIEFIHPNSTDSERLRSGMVFCSFLFPWPKFQENESAYNRNLAPDSIWYLGTP